MALEHFALMASALFSRAQSEMRKHGEGILPGDLDKRATEVATVNFTKVRRLWYPIRDVVAGKKSKIYSQLTAGGEKYYAPSENRDALRTWFLERFFERHTFYVERANGTVKEIDTADPVRVH